jgi:hypothetical protein
MPRYTIIGEIKRLVDKFITSTRLLLYMKASGAEKPKQLLIVSDSHTSSCCNNFLVGVEG